MDAIGGTSIGMLNSSKFVLPMSVADLDIILTYFVSNNSFSWVLAYSGMSAAGVTVWIISCISASNCRLVLDEISGNSWFVNFFVSCKFANGFIVCVLALFSVDQSMQEILSTFADLVKVPISVFFPNDMGLLPVFKTWMFNSLGILWSTLCSTIKGIISSGNWNLQYFCIWHIGCFNCYYWNRIWL